MEGTAILAGAMTSILKWTSVRVAFPLRPPCLGWCEIPGYAAYYRAPFIQRCIREAASLCRSALYRLRQRKLALICD